MVPLTHWERCPPLATQDFVAGAGHFIPLLDTLRIWPGIFWPSSSKRPENSEKYVNSRAELAHRSLFLNQCRFSQSAESRAIV
jgi:hypothetical protein